MPKKATSKKESFAADFQKLEALVERMESGELDIDESLKSFESGLALAQELKKRLKGVDAKIQKLKKTYSDD